jgi:hypothetical protein
MKIALCGSLSFHEEIIRLKEELRSMNYEVLIPASIELYGPKVEEIKGDRNRYLRIAPDFIRMHFDKIANSDAILVVNLEKNGIKNYIGGNTFAEIMLAFYLKKKIFLLNPIPTDEKLSSIKNEIEVVKPIILNGDLSLMSESNV